MKNKSLKLAEIITDYPYFEENQVLTDEQLNTVVSYLDQQNRLTRRNLHGYGTVCGLNIAFGNNVITISKGCGLTTDGDLLELPKSTAYSNFREYKDVNAKYPLFDNVTVYELFPDTGKVPKDAKKLNLFKKHTEQRLEDQAVMLYLESYYFDPDICTGGDCDNKGQEQINRLRVILIPKNYLDKTGLGFSPAKKYFQLDRVHVARLKLNATSIDNFDKLSSAYLSLIKKTGKSFSEALSKSYSLLQPAFTGNFGNADPTKAWLKELERIIAKVSTSKLITQSVYELLKDLAAAYNEFVESVYHWETECLPDIQTCPKHLLLGDATASTDDRIDSYRQEFVPSPALRGMGDKRKKMLFLFNRIGKLIMAYDGPASDGIRITPSRINGMLGERAIPAYYKVEEKFNENWDYDLHTRDRDNEILSYHARKYSNEQAIVNPTDYAWDGCDMYRIEGHTGMNFKTALEAVEKMIREDNLPFRVLPLLIEHDKKNVWFFPKYKYYGMEILHKLYRDEVVHNLNDLKKFNLELNSKVQAADDEKLPPVDIESNTLSMKAFSLEQTNLVNQKIDQTKNFLAASIVDFDSDNFESKYNDVINQSAVFNKGIKNVTATSAFTPLDKTVNNINFSKLKWIKDLVKKREEKAQERGILEEFLKEHPGLEHLGGVPRGGTFILVYSSADKKVVADFALPYMYYDEPVQEVPEGSDTSDDKLVFEWKLKNDLRVHINQNHILKGQISELDNKVNKVQLDLNAQAVNLGSYQGSINTLIQTLPTYTWSGVGGSIVGGDFQIPGLGESMEVIDGISRVKDRYSKRKEAGLTTPEEDNMIEKLDDYAADVMEDVLDKTEAAGEDIKPGGRDSQALNKLAENYNKIGKDSAKNRVANKASNVMNKLSGKSNLKGFVGMFKK